MYVVCMIHTTYRLLILLIFFLGITMIYQAKLGKNNQIPLPDNICRELGINLGDILICELADNSSLVMRKHTDQTLSDADIAVDGNLIRVTPYVID